MNELTNMMLNHLHTATREELDREWEELKESNSIGYLVSTIATEVLRAHSMQITTDQNLTTTYESPDSSGLFLIHFYYGSSSI